MKRSLVVGVDGAGESTNALARAAELAQAAGLRLVVVHVRHIPVLAEMSAMTIGPATQDLDVIEAASRRAADDVLQDTGRLILEALTPSLGLPRSYFEPLLTERNSVLRLLHYPPISGDALAGSLRSAPHEDINLITLLVAPEGPGLEMLDRDDHWLPIPSQPHDLIVDAGDMLARMTNDVIPATTHRVVNPNGMNRSRYSMPFFMHPNPDVVLRCVESCLGDGAKHADITAGAFLEQRLQEIGLLRTKQR